MGINSSLGFFETLSGLHGIAEHKIIGPEWRTTLTAAQLESAFGPNHAELFARQSERMGRFYDASFGGDRHINWVVVSNILEDLQSAVAESPEDED